MAVILCILVFYLKRHQPVSELRNKIDFDILISLAALVPPIRKMGGFRIVSCEYVFKKGRFNSSAQPFGLFEKSAAKQQNRAGQGCIGKINLVSAAEHFLSITMRLQSVDQMGSFKQIQEIRADCCSRPRVPCKHTQIQRCLRHGNKKKTEKKYLDIEHSTDAIKGGHVAFENLVNDVLAQQTLAARKIVDHRRLKGNHLATDSRGNAPSSRAPQMQSAQIQSVPSQTMFGAILPKATTASRPRATAGTQRTKVSLAESSPTGPLLIQRMRCAETLADPVTAIRWPGSKST